MDYDFEISRVVCVTIIGLKPLSKIMMWNGSTLPYFSGYKTVVSF